MNLHLAVDQDTHHKTEWAQCGLQSLRQWGWFSQQAHFEPASKLPATGTSQKGWGPLGCEAATHAQHK